MQIKIEIDVKPEELRRFLGLPDVAGLQDDVVRYIRQKVGAAGDNFDPGAVIEGGFELFKRTPAWRKLRTAWEGTGATADVATDLAEEAEAAASPPKRRRKAGAAKTPRQRAPRKRAGKTAPPADDDDA